jgi:hypothetical protein
MKSGGQNSRHWQGAAPSKAPWPAQCRAALPAIGPNRNNPYRRVYLYERCALPVDIMLLLAAVAAAAAGTATEAPPRASAVPVAAEATATVRIVRGVRLKLDSQLNDGAPPAHDSKVRSDGEVRPARLIEFE